MTRTRFKRSLCVCDHALSSKVVRKKKGELLRKEFIDTEASYVQNLDTIIKAPTTALKALFSHLTLIIIINRRRRRRHHHHRHHHRHHRQVFLNPLKDLAAQGEHRAIISAAHADLIFGRCRTTRSPFLLPRSIGTLTPASIQSGAPAPHAPRAARGIQERSVCGGVCGGVCGSVCG
jgi:hypothetical protein